MYVLTTLTGRLARDAELHFTADGTAVCSFTVMTSRRYYNKQTEKWEDRDVTGWRCTAFNSPNAPFAENLAETFFKGDAVIVQGQLAERTWDDRQGETKSRIEMRVDAAGHDFRWGIPGKGKEE